jgi:hypothetical protein
MFDLYYEHKELSNLVSLHVTIKGTDILTTVHRRIVYVIYT